MDESADVGRRDTEEHPRFEELLIELSTRFVNLLPDAVNQEIERALGRVCEQLGVDLAVLWQWSDGVPRVISPTHIYRSGGVRSAAPGVVPAGRAADA